MDKEHIFFENYAATWDTVRGENPPLLTRLVLFAGLARGVRVLDVGCGTGTLAPYLLRAVGEEGQVEELDYSHQMLLQAKKKLNRYKNVAYTEKNILKYRMADATYDAVVCLNFYPHITSSKETFVRKMAAALKPDGALIIMHDLPRMHVNNWNERQPDFDAGALPPVDIMTTLLITAGLTVTIAMDTDEFYFIKAVKQQRDHYEEYAEPDLSDEKAVSHLRSHLDGHIRGLAEHTHDEVEPHVHPHVHEHPHTEEHHHGHVHSHTQTKMVLNRLARISGHIEAVKRMVEDGRDCSEVLIQIAAVDSALVSVGKVILSDHIDHCIVDAIHDNDTKVVENLKKAINTFIK